MAQLKGLNGNNKRRMKRYGNTTHGGSGTRLYHIWSNMKARCQNPRNQSYADYGGRGIYVCPEWFSSYATFQEWALLNGYAANLTIDRRNTNGNYEPSNCRWVTYSRNNRNKRNTPLYTAFSETKCLKDWSEDSRCLANYQTLQQRVRTQGWRIEVALATPSSNPGGRAPRRAAALAAFGKMRSLADWARDSRCVVSYNTLKQRLHYGWALELAITTPLCPGIRPLAALRPLAA